MKYITVNSLEHVSIDHENFLYLVFKNVDGYITGKNGFKYLYFASKDENKVFLE